MNSTKWPSLTEFAKHLGREGICRVEETEKGLHISWIDNSPDALRRQEALRKKEAQDQGDEELEQRMIREQIRRAQKTAGHREGDAEDDGEDRELKRQEGEKITLSFGVKPTFEGMGQKLNDSSQPPTPLNESSSTKPEATGESDRPVTKPSGLGGGISLKLGTKPTSKNVFAQAKKNALSSGPKKPSVFGQPKKISEAERIMREEMEKKRPRESTGFAMPDGKKQKNR